MARVDPEEAWVKRRAGCPCSEAETRQNGRRHHGHAASRIIRAASKQSSDIILMAMTWAGSAVEQPTITGQTRLGPDSVPPSSVCNDCTFSRAIHGDASKNF